MYARWNISHVEFYSNLTLAKEREVIFFSILQKGGLQPYEAALRKKARCKYGRILLLTSQFCLTWLACRSRPWTACLKIEGWRMGQKLSLASIIFSPAKLPLVQFSARFQVFKGRLTNEIDFSPHTIKRTLSLNPGP